MIGSLLLGGIIGFQFSTLNTPDPYDYAQLARNIAEGQGFTTDIISPISWSKVPRLQGHPDLWRAPLYPLLIATGFILFGVHESVLVIVSAVFFLGFVCFLYLVGERTFGPVPGLLAGLFALTAPILVRAGVTGHTEALYMMLVFAGVFFVLDDSDHPYLIGLFSGLAYLTRYNHWFYFLALMVVALKRCNQRRLSYFTKVMGTFLVLISPWIIRNVLLVGQPFYHHHMYLLASHNSLMKNFSVFYTFDPPNLLGFVVEYPHLLLEKWVMNLWKLYGWIPRFVSQFWILAVLSVAEMMSGSPDPENRRRDLLMMVGLGFLLQAVFLSAVHLKARHYLPFLPVLFLFGGASVHRIYRKAPRWIGRGVIIGLLMINGLFLFQLDPWPATVNPSAYRELQEIVPAEEPILTNAPELTAWYAERTALWVAPYREVNQHYPNFNFVLLSEAMARNYSPKTDIWKHYLRNQDFLNDFTLLREFPSDHARLYVRSGSN
jgi:4-amino-4-deoxy-L-arabinose transferase-like glycosyltransferase